ncbi:cysteine--tRNA ligase [Campylobacter sp. MIT 21-1685]|uniref:cysteine--tRNA ligase n=1 Tax=unclassified Campylobacter TaxID=2593542 RepID=UPI00224A99CC|nr:MULTISPECIES: cysteine--tRNA ligase [unclassified Campylobacter]MCX2683595.1 cysteine--tRNA ligase [Campylobacter sp. MIT 21-1684]MCX2751878.1 cysteine--tRNA ligase [Campylobacter sp. MIT 21-1682]MCX2808069.1 cysteine--tRNA ligase [Campylobacter sp. MIT 21-1685]
MYLFDSVSKQKKQVNSKKINFYLCGPTVYDDAHLGHARSSVCFDLLYRFFLLNGFEVQFVQNYTDIDDKILAKMQETGKNLDELTQEYIDSYERDMRALNVLEPDIKPRATHYINEMLELITQLDKEGFVYVLEDGMYFDTSKDKKYLSLSKRDEKENLSRLEKKTAKRNESDFVLWKFDENFYQSDFGTGRPGWHTECVAMIHSLFKEGLDIHAGGIDLFFPHHENEAAQCRCAFHSELAKIWLHNGFVQIGGEKMSKSLGNSFFLKDGLKLFMGEVLRLYLLSSHYRSHFSYALDDLYSCKKRLDKFYRLKKRLELGFIEDLQKGRVYQCSSDIARQVNEFLRDDLNISKALAALDEFLIYSNARLDLEKHNKALKQDLRKALQELALIFGFGLKDTKSYFQFGVDERQKQEIESKIAQRTQAKKAKDFSKADAIRAALEAEGIVLLDTANGTVWEKMNG